MSAKRISNMLDAALRPPPSIEEFMAVIAALLEVPAANTNIDSLFGEAFDGSVSAKPRGTVCVGKAACKAIATFHKLCKDKNKVYETLDDFMVGFAKWVLSVEVLADTEEQRHLIGQQRRTLCGNTYPVYNISPTTMRTYVNGLATVWNQQNTEVKVVLSSLMQFSKFNEFMRVCVTRWYPRRTIWLQMRSLSSCIVRRTSACHTKLKYITSWSWHSIWEHDLR